MDELFRLGLTNAAWATALAVVASFGAWFCGRRPAVVHVLWLLVLIKLVTPSLVHIALPVSDAVNSDASKEPATSSSAYMPTAGRVSEQRSQAVAPAALVSRERRTSTAVRETLATTIASPSNWRPAVFSLWLMGALAWGAIVVTSAVRFRRLIRAACPASRELTDRAGDVAAKLGLRGLPTISLVSARVPPMLWATLFGRPQLILPEELWARFDASQQEAVLAHELAHWKRLDHWVRRLEAIVMGLYWWYPVTWWTRRQLERAEEECCDAWVVWALPSAAGSYAEALVATAAFLSGLRQPLPPGASGAGRTRPLKRRLNMILRDRSAGPVARTTPLVVLSLGLFALPFLPALGSAQQAGSPGTSAPAPAQSSQQPSQANPAPDEKEKQSAQKGGAFKLVALDPTKPDKKTRICQPIVREVSDYVVYQGLLEAAHTVQLRPRVSGMITDVRCRPGEVVKVNDLLFQIDARPYRAELDKAEAELRRVEARVRRVTFELGYNKKLQNDRVVSANEVALSESEVAEAEASLLAAKADRDLAKLKADATQVRAPVAGTVSGPILDVGNVVVADTTTLATIVALDPMHVVFGLDQDAALKLKSQAKTQPGTALLITVGVGGFGEGRITRSAKLDLTDLKSIDGRVERRAVVSNHDGALFPGLSAHVRLVTSSPSKAVLVPETAVAQRSFGRLEVDVVNEKNEVEARQVQVGLLYDGLRVVTQGLRPNEWVIAETPPPPPAVE